MRFLVKKVFVQKLFGSVPQPIMMQKQNSEMSLILFCSILNQVTTLLTYNTCPMILNMLKIFIGSQMKTGEDIG
jgi:hypothetical protein